MLSVEYYPLEKDKLLVTVLSVARFHWHSENVSNMTLSVEYNPWEKDNLLETGAESITVNSKGRWMPISLGE